MTLLFNNDDYIELDNCVIWNNSANSASDIYEGRASTAIPLRSESIKRYDGVSNLNADPLFVDLDGPDDIFSEDDNASLQSSSPAINHGSVSLAGYLSTDILGKHRGEDSDAGAFEYSTNSAPTFYSDSNFSITENQSFVFDINATDQDGDNLIFSISGGVDEDKFSLNPTTKFQFSRFFLQMKEVIMFMTLIFLFQMVKFQFSNLFQLLLRMS